ncbi:hypothetical protein BD413DRAFT_542670 [Trametes elegans]|nr:hypothetical protein BD413DRAFT_542670 [Trametes elegans]
MRTDWEDGLERKRQKPNSTTELDSVLPNGLRASHHHSGSFLHSCGSWHTRVYYRLMPRPPRAATLGIHTPRPPLSRTRVEYRRKARQCRAQHWHARRVVPPLARGWPRTQGKMDDSHAGLMPGHISVIVAVSRQHGPHRSLLQPKCDSCCHRAAWQFASQFCP